MRNRPVPHLCHASAALVLGLVLSLFLCRAEALDLDVHFAKEVGNTNAGYTQDAATYTQQSVSVVLGEGVSNGTYAFWYRRTNSGTGSTVDDYFLLTVNNGVATITDGWTHLGGNPVQLGLASGWNVTYSALRADIANVGNSGDYVNLTGDTVLTRTDTANDSGAGVNKNASLVLHLGYVRASVTTKFEMISASECPEGATLHLIVDGVEVGTSSVPEGTMAQPQSGHDIISITQESGHVGSYYWQYVDHLGNVVDATAPKGYLANVSPGFDGTGASLGSVNVDNFTLTCPGADPTPTPSPSPSPSPSSSPTPTIGPPPTPGTPVNPRISVSGGNPAGDVIVDNPNDFYEPFKKALDDFANEDYGFQPSPLFDANRHAINDDESKTKEDGLRSAWSNLTSLGGAIKGRLDTLKTAFNDAYERGRLIQIAQQNPGMAYLFLIQVHGHTYPVDLSPYQSVIGWLRRLQVFIVTVVFWRMTLKILGTAFFPE